MKKWKVILLLVVILPVILICASYLSFRYSGNCDPASLSSVSFRDGDLVFRRGRSIESFTVVLAGKDNEFSHIGVIRMEGKVPYVIHAEPGETALEPKPVTMEPLTEFLGAGKASHFAVYRSRMGKDELRRVMEKAMHFFSGRCCFDNSFDLADDQKVYCTELVLKAYRSVNPGMSRMMKDLTEVNLLFRKQKILMPSAFIHSEFFYRILAQ